MKNLLRLVLRLMVLLMLPLAVVCLTFELARMLVIRFISDLVGFSLDE
jgi:hypothetical protein